jgi:hypothetical protein
MLQDPPRRPNRRGQPSPTRYFSGDVPDPAPHAASLDAVAISAERTKCFSQSWRSHFEKTTAMGLRPCLIATEPRAPPWVYPHAIGSLSAALSRSLRRDCALVAPGTLSWWQGRVTLRCWL